MPLRVAIVSDSTGETAESMLKAALAQFDGLEVEFQRYRSVTDADQAREIVAEFADRQGHLMVTTLVCDSVREALTAAARGRLQVVHLMAPVVEALASITGLMPQERPGAIRQMDQRYQRRVKAIEFTINCDDGKQPHLAPQADVVIFGVSRSGKTPLSMFLALKGYAVANVPLLPGVAPDDHIWEVPERRRVGLLISPQRLQEIRSERLIQMGLDPSRSSYASLERIESELAQARQLMERLHCRIYESTSRPMEELAQIILSDLNLNAH